MKVEVLYVVECPSHPAAVKLVRDVLVYCPTNKWQ
jgi:hypothetical protein